MSGLPKISCICITRDRPHFLQEAIKCFLDQDYPNKELVIIMEQDDPTAKEIEIEGVRTFILPSQNLTLGELRNYGVTRSTGSYIAQWDDDDWNHPTRLSRQYDELNGYDGNLLCRVTVLDKLRDQRYLSHHYLWEGTILIKKSMIEKHPYPSLKRGEDTPVIEALLREGCLRTINAPELYTYVYHGDNTWDFSHFRDIFAHCIKL